MPGLVDEDKLIIGRNDLDQVGGVVKEVAELFFALAQRFFGLALFGNVFADGLVLDHLAALNDDPVDPALPANLTVGSQSSVLIF